MVNYICKNCNKNFNRKSNYDYHINNKKKPCNQHLLISHQSSVTPQNCSVTPQQCSVTPQQCSVIPQNNLTYLEGSDKVKLNNIELNLKIYKCDKCDKEFKKKFNLNRHLITCKIQKKLQELKKKLQEPKIEPKIEAKTEPKNNMVNIDELDIDDQTKIILTVLLNQNKKLLEEIDLIKSKNNKLEEVINKIDKIDKIDKKKIIKTNNINTTNTNTNITTNILNNQSNTINNTIILAHGKEDLSKIELETIMGCMSTFKHREIIPSITKHVYLNDKKPENKNFCVVDTARNKCKYFDGTKWVIGKTNDKVNKIFDNMHNMLTEPFEKENINKTIEFIKTNPKKFNEKWIKISNTYLKSLYDEDDKENIENKAKVLEELKLIFFNNKDEILKIK
jgi:hypothetical protein